MFFLVFISALETKHLISTLTAIHDRPNGLIHIDSSASGIYATPGFAIFLRIDSVIVDREHNKDVTTDPDQVFMLEYTHHVTSDTPDCLKINLAFSHPTLEEKQHDQIINKTEIKDIHTDGEFISLS